MSQIVMYTTPTCSACEAARSFLAEHDFPFVVVDINESREDAERVLEATHQLSVPSFEIDGEWVIGFNKSKLRKMLNGD